MKQYIVDDRTGEINQIGPFEAESEINEEGKTELENNIIDGLRYWAGGAGLCPEQMDGYTVDVRTDME